MKQKLLNFSIHKKLMLIYIAAFIIPIFCITFYSIYGMIRIFNEKSMVERQAQCNQIAANIGAKLNEFYKSVISFSNTQSINDFFEFEYPDNSSFFEAYPKVSSHLSSFRVGNPTLSDLIVYTDNSTFLANGSSIRVLTPEFSDYYAACISRYSEIPVVVSDILYTRNAPSLNLLYHFSYYKNPMHHTVVQITYPENIIYSLYEHELNKLDIYLVSPVGDVFSSGNRDSIGKAAFNYETVRDITNSQIPAGELTSVAGKLFYHITYSDVRLLNGWQLYIEASNASYMKDVSALILQALLLILVVSLVGMALYMLCALSISKRLNRLVNAMSLVRNDDTLTAGFTEESTDEIGILSQNFIEMLERIKKLIFDVYSSDLRVKDLEIKHKQAELKALQSQINPHFLFNTMQSLSISCYNNDDYETAGYIQTFSNFLRDCLYWETKCVPLSEELRVAKNYLSLQKFRYADLFDFEIEIPQMLYDVAIPKFTLQPIVENAIEHGLEGLGRKGFIRIWASQREDHISIMIEDNGLGISKERLEALNVSLSAGSMADETDSIGIFNTHQRLKLYFGPAFGIRLNSLPNVGTEVMISITRKGGEDVSGIIGR